MIIIIDIRRVFDNNLFIVPQRFIEFIEGKLNYNCNNCLSSNVYEKKYNFKSSLENRDALGNINLAIYSLAKCLNLPSQSSINVIDM